MSLEPGTLVLGKASRSRGNQRLEPQFVLVDNGWEGIERGDFESSLPLKITSDLPAKTANVPVVAELTEPPILPGRERPKFVLTSVRMANLVIDQRHAGPVHRIAEKIGELSPPGLASESTEIFIWCERDTLLGPLRLSKRKIYAPSPEKLAIRRSAGIAVTEIDGCMVGDRFDRLEVLDYLDCRPIEEVLDEVTTLAVSTLTRLDCDESHIRSAKEALTKVHNWISDRSGPDGSTLDPHRVERALQACNDAETQHRWASQIADTLKSLPAVKARMDQEIQAARAEAERAELNEIAARVAQGNDRLAGLGKHVDAARSELQQLNEQIAKAKHDLITAKQMVDTRNEELRGEVAIAVEELVTGTRERLASSIIVQALTGHSTPVQPPRAPAPTSINLRPVAKSVLTERVEIRRSLSAAAKASGMKGPAAERLLAAFTAGLLPVTFGNGGPASLSAIAAVMFSGRIARIPVAHDFLHPTDLMGLHSAKPGTFRCHHGVLEAANSAAAAGEVMVLLDGINQAPTESYLLPWLQSHWDDTGFAAVQPHPNLRVAGTVATGITSARISPDLWGFAVAVDTAGLPASSVRSEFSRITLPDPVESAEAAESANEVVEYLLTDVEPIWPFSDDIVTAAERFAVALQSLQEEQYIQQSVAECILLPAGATSLAAGEYEEFVSGLAKNMSLTEEMATRFHTLAKRLRMRLA